MKLIAFNFGIRPCNKPIFYKGPNPKLLRESALPGLITRDDDWLLLPTRQ